MAYHLAQSSRIANQPSRHLRIDLPEQLKPLAVGLHRQRTKRFEQRIFQMEIDGFENHFAGPRA
jgi:hypothetical protein